MSLVPMWDEQAPMTVANLREFLKQYPDDLLVGAMTPGEFGNAGTHGLIYRSSFEIDDDALFCSFYCPEGTERVLFIYGIEPRRDIISSLG